MYHGFHPSKLITITSVEITAARVNQVMKMKGTNNLRWWMQCLRIQSTLPFAEYHSSSATITQNAVHNLKHTRAGEKPKNLSSKFTKVFMDAKKKGITKNHPRLTKPSPLSQQQISEETIHMKVASVVKDGKWDHLHKLMDTDFGTSDISQVIFLLRGRPRLANQFLIWAEENKGIKPDMQALCAVAHILVKARMPGPARRYLIRAIGEASGSYKPVFNTLVATYQDFSSSPMVLDFLVMVCADTGMTESAVECFGQMEIFGFLPRIETCNALLSALVKNNELDATWIVYAEMLRCKIVSNIETFNIMIGALCKQGKVKKARELFGQLEIMGFKPNVVTYNILIAAYCKRENVEGALELFVALGDSADVSSYCAIVSVLCNEGRVDEAVGIFGKMKESGLEATVVIYRALIEGLCDKGRVVEASDLKNEMAEKGFEVTVCIYNPLLYALLYHGKIVEARQMLAEMTDKGVSSDGATYNVLVNGYCQHGMLAEAVLEKSKMVSQELAVTDAAYTSLIYECCRLGTLEEAEGFLEEMKKSDMFPHAIAYNALINRYCEKGNVTRAIQLLDEMDAKDIAGSHLIYRGLVYGFCKCGQVKQAKKLLDEMRKRGMQPDHDTFNVVIKTSAKKGTEENFVQLIELASWKEISPKIFNYRSFSQGQCKKPELEVTKKVLQGMVQKALEIA